MPCIPLDPKAEGAESARAAIARLEAALSLGAASVAIGPQGGIAFRGWKDTAGVSDLCAYRKLTAENSPALRKAIARAEVFSGRKIDPVAVAQGTHSHDGGKSWSRH